MSWLTPNLNISDSLSSLSNITGQISNFTREMLTEGTEEVADPSAELTVAKQQIRQLEIVLESQKFEYEKLMKLNEELHERVEAANLQARDVARDYRAQLDQKEKEIMRLKEECNKNDHDHGSQESSWNRIRHDSIDSIDEHEEIKKLRNEIIRLQTECHHWKTLSSSQDSQDKLHREIDQYQHELTTLQSTYSQKIANLNKKHKLEIQQWEDEKHGYQRKIEDLQHELTILEEVDNLEGMKSISHSSGDDVTALKEELELAHDTITNLRKQLDKAAESFKSNETEFENMKRQLEERTSKLSETQQQLADGEKLQEKANRHHEKNRDIKTLQEQLIERENNLASLSNEINLLKEQLNEQEAEVSSISEERDKLKFKENELQNSLNEVKKELESLSSSTLELMEELEYSHEAQDEQRVEIESLKKVCLVEGDAKDEIVHLKTIIGALWDRYVATLQLYQKANNQSIRKQVADVKAKLNDKNAKRQEKVYKEKEQLITKSSELRAQIDEQENLVEDLRADNEQIFQETKDLISEIGCQTTNDSLDEGNDLVVSLQAEKAVLESTIVGLQNKVQELKERLRERNGKPTKVDTSDYYFSEEKGLDYSDSVAEVEVESMESIPLNEEQNYGDQEQSPRGTILEKEIYVDHEQVIEQLRQEVEEYRSNIEDLEYIKTDLENDKSTLEQVVINLKTQIKELREDMKKIEENSSTTTAKDAKALDLLGEEKEKLIQEKIDLTKALRSLEDELIECQIISKDDMGGFENEMERADVLRLHLKEWVIRTRKTLREAEEREANKSVISVNLEEKSLLEEEYQNAKKMIEELEGDNSILREQTNDLIHQIESKTTEVELISAQLEEKCYEVRNFEEEKQNMMTMINERDVKILDLQESYDSQILDVSVLKDDEKNLLQDKLEEEKKECEKYKKSNEDLMKSFHEKQQAFEDLSLEKEELIQILEEKKKECEKFQKSNEELMNSFQEEHQAVVDLGHEQEGIVQILEEKKKECEKYKKSNEELMTSFQEKHQAFEDLGTENTSLTEQVRESEILLRDLRQEKENLLALLESKEQLVNSLSEESKIFATEKDELSLVVKEYQDKLRSKEQEMAEVSHLHFEVEQLKIQARDSETSKNSLEERISSLSADNERLSSSLDEKNMVLNHLEAEIKEKRSEVEHLDLEMDKLNELVGSNVAFRRDLEHQISTLKKKKDDLERLVDEKDRTIDKIKLDMREKGSENDLLRLDIARIGKTLKEKEMLLQNEAGTTTVDGRAGVGEQETQNQVSRMICLLQEKEQEIEAMKQKEASLIAAVNQTDQTSHEALDHYVQQITHLTEETNRLMTEIERKDEELLYANDKLEVLQEKMSGKAQASVVLQGEHSRLLALNESQGNEIAKMRERNDYMVKLLDEKEKAKHNEMQRMHNEFSQEFNELKREQERLLTLVSEKDRQIVALADATAPVKAAQMYSSKQPVLEEVLQTSESSMTQNGVPRSDVELKDQQIAALEGQLSNSNRNLREKIELNEKLENEINDLRINVEKLNNNLNELRKKSSLLEDKESRIRFLEEEVENLQGTLNLSRKELSIIEETHSNAKESILSELENLRIEKQEMLETSSKEVSELKNKLIKAFNSLGDCDVSSSEQGFEEIDKNYNGIVQRIINKRNSVLREKDSEIRTLKGQISSLNVLTHTSDSRDYELEEVLREKEELDEQIMRLDYEKEDILQEKESIVSDLQSQIINLTKIVSEKDKAKSQDTERLIREKDRIEKELEKINVEKEKNAATLSRKENEFAKLTTENNRLLNLLAEEKSNAAKLHTNTDQYKQVLQEKDNRINELSREKEELSKKSDSLEQRIIVLQNDLTKACGGKRETEAKSSRELERLRDHLLQVEESYTKEILEAKEREKNLRIRLAQQEEQLVSTKDRSRQTNQQLESLQEQLHLLASQRDEAVMQVASAEEQTQQYATSLNNLQMVLEQFQREKETQFSIVQDQAQQQINAARTEVMQIQQRENELRVQLQNAASIVQELGRLKQEVASRDEEISQHKASVAKYEEELRVSHNMIRDMNKTNDNKVDKTLLKNLLHGYFNTPEGKRADVVHVIGGLLGFTQEEMMKIGTGSTPPSQGGWISSFLPFGGPPKSPTVKNNPHPTDRSFSELFVNFLQHESDTTGTPLPGRPGNTTNPLLTGLTSKPIPLSQPPTDRRHPLASSTPLPSRPPAVSSVAMTTASPAPSPLTAPVGISPITPMVRPRMPNDVAPRPSMANAYQGINPRPPVIQPLPTSGNPLLYGSMTPVQSLPSITSSGPSSLRGVLFQNGSQ